MTIDKFAKYTNYAHSRTDTTMSARNLFPPTTYSDHAHRRSLHCHIPSRGLIRRQVMSRAAMEARRAGTETGEVQEAQHGEGQMQRQERVNASRIGRRVAGHCGIGRVCGSDEKRGRARRQWRSVVGQRWLVRKLDAGRSRVDWQIRRWNK